jgi:hypothetical protein
MVILSMFLYAKIFDALMSMILDYSTYMTVPKVDGCSRLEQRAGS